MQDNIHIETICSATEKLQMRLFAQRYLQGLTPEHIQEQIDHCADWHNEFYQHHEKKEGVKIIYSPYDVQDQVAVLVVSVMPYDLYCDCDEVYGYEFYLPRCKYSKGTEATK